MKKSQRSSTSNLSPLILAFAGLIIVVLAIGLVVLGSDESEPEVSSSNQSNNAGSDVHDDEGIPYPEVLRISLADAKAQYDANTAVFVDVRSAGEHEASRIPGAISLPLEELQASYQELPTDALIFLYCTWPNEEKSARAARILIDLGYENAQAVRYGLRGWQEAGYPMAGTEFEGTG